jgi:hypothetical protein
MPAHQIPKTIDGKPVDLLRQIKSIETAGEEFVQLFEWDDHFVAITRIREGAGFETRAVTREEVRRAATRGGR